MFKLSTALIFVNFLRVIYARDPLHKSGQDLVEITPGHELPLVLFEEVIEIETGQPLSTALMHQEREVITESGKVIEINEIPAGTLAKSAFRISQLNFPYDSFKPEVKEGRLVKGTKFISESSTTQIFFCPKVETEFNCLAPLEFIESQPLECPTEAIPTVHMDVSLGKCGPDDSGDLYSTGYDICRAEPPYSYTTDHMVLYYICYNDDKKSTIFTQHSITSPNLLESQMLVKERKVTYPYQNSEFKLSIFYDSLNPYLESLVYPGKPAYKVQKLVPDKNMAFALWRKTTYKNYNVTWQHQSLAPLWDKINDYIRSHATKITYGNDTIQYSIHTGVFDVPSTTFKDDQMSNIWVNMITILPKSMQNILFSDYGDPRGIAVLMNNFIDVKTDDPALETPLRQREMAIEKYCAVSKCTKALQDEFRSIGGQVRCCPLTAQICELFDAINFRNMLELEIPGINVEKTDSYV